MSAPASLPAPSAVFTELAPAEIAEIASKVDASFRKEKLNTVEKRKKLSEARHRAYIDSDERLLVNVINFDGLSRPHLIARQRAFARASVAWLEANPGDDMDAEHRALHLRLAGDDLARALDLELALSEVQGIEEDWDEPSRTRKLLKERLDEAMYGIGSWLSGILTVEQVELLKRLGYGGDHTWRWRPRWRLDRNRTRTSGARVILLDAPLRVHLCESFESCLRHADTQRDVRALLACWGEEAELVRDAKCPRFVGRGFEIFAT